MVIETKICGIRDRAALRAAVGHGASYAGFVFYPASPRAIEPEMAASLAATVPDTIGRVGLFVDAGDAEIAAVTDVVPLDYLQFHGHENARRVREAKSRFGLPVIKALRIAGANDLARVADYEGDADMILLDAAAPGTLPGGNGVAFDWALLAGFECAAPWMLSGGLTAGNVGAALRATGARRVDVSSGVESTRGVKCAERIAGFLKAVAMAEAA